MKFITQLIQNHDENLLKKFKALYAHQKKDDLLKLILSINHEKMVENERVTDKIQQEVVMAFLIESQKSQEIIRISKKLKKDGDINEAKKDTADFLSKTVKKSSAHYDEAYSVRDHIADHIYSSNLFINTIEVFQKNVDSKEIDLLNALTEVSLNMKTFSKILDSIKDMVDILQDKRVQHINKMNTAVQKLK